MMAAAAQFRPDTIVVLGDFADFYAVSFHSKDPRRALTLESEVKDVRLGLDALDSLGASRKVFVAGNHEHRLERYLCDKAPALFGLVDVPELFELKDRDWEYVPYMDGIDIGKLYVTHDLGKCGKYAIQSARDDVEGNVVIGHIHRMGLHYQGNAKGVPKLAAAFGWLGDFDEIGYKHKRTALKDWTHGFGIGYMNAKGDVFLQGIPIFDGKCCVEGKIVGS